MNPPYQPTPRTDEATYRADCLGKTLVVNRNCAAALETELSAVQAECLEQARLLGISGSREASLIARLEKAETELTRLRALFPAILAALRNGGCCTTDVSVEFLECVPNEVASVVSRLRAEVERLLIIEKQFKQSRQAMKEDSK